MAEVMTARQEHIGCTLVAVGILAAIVGLVIYRGPLELFMDFIGIIGTR